MATAAIPAAVAGGGFQDHRYVDIGMNLTDPVFQGVYHGKRHHPDDLAAVVDRAKAVGVKKLLVTGSDVPSSRSAIELARRFPGCIYTTLGIHPCSSAEFTNDKASSLLSDLRHVYDQAVEPGRPHCIAAAGEFGLDYDRLEHCPRETQLYSFKTQLSFVLTLPAALPLFLHSRAAHADFVACLRENDFLARHASRMHDASTQAPSGPSTDLPPRLGVVHSFTGTPAEMHELLALGLYIGINGCSLKTPANLAVVEALPLSRLLLETDGPWCEIRPSHASWAHLRGVDVAGSGGAAGGMEDGGAKTPASNSAKSTTPAASTSAPLTPPYKFLKKEKWQPGALVKGRNEPCLLPRVAAVVASVKGVSVDEVVEAAWRNSVYLFGMGDEEEER